MKYKRKRDQSATTPNQPEVLPVVTVQLPLYNERYVVERLIDSIVKLNYPKDKLEIQVLDDSDDECYDIAAQKVIEYRALGFDIKHLKRINRVGFKAGALDFGLKQAKGEFCAIFDADFIPDPDFLKRTISLFSDNNLAMVQSRWDHLNRDYSLLTKLQAFGLDAHFSVEQVGRNQGHHFINFNGTAGLWRIKAIIDAGGWSADTLTEDLDLSYRVQLKGWTFKYLESLKSPAELPVVMSAIKTQQYRWNKGAAECARKNLLSVLTHRKVSNGTKIHAFFHLLNSGIFVAIFFYALLSLPLLFLKSSFGQFQFLYFLSYSFFAALIILGTVYFVSMKKEGNLSRNLWKFISIFPSFLVMSMGLSFHNALAVIAGYLGKKSPFIRTPKFGISRKSDDWTSKQYLSKIFDLQLLMEGFFAIYFIVGIYFQWRQNDYTLIPLHVLLTIGFSMIFFFSVQHALQAIQKEA